MNIGSCHEYEAKIRKKETKKGGKVHDDGWRVGISSILPLWIVFSCMKL